MPTNRTPNKQKQPDGVSTKPYLTTEGNDGSSVTSRSKKKQDSYQREDFEAFMSEMRAMFDGFTKQQDLQLENIRKTMKDIKDQNSGIQEAISFMSAKYEEVKDQLDILQKEKKEDKELIRQLEFKVESLERNSKVCTIDIRNLPCKATESTGCLTDLVVKTGNALKVPIQTSDIKNVFRTNTRAATATNKPITVEFTTVLTKERLIKAFKDSSKKQRLTTKTMNLDGPDTPVYIAESLTVNTKRLFYLARDFAKTYGYTFCWTNNNKVYLRKKEGASCTRIDSESDLKKLQANEEQRVPTNSAA